MKKDIEEIYLVDLLEEAKDNSIKYYLSGGQLDSAINIIFGVSSNAAIYVDGTNDYGEFEDKALWEMINGIPTAYAIVVSDFRNLVKSRCSIINVLMTLQKNSIKLYIMSSYNTKLVPIDIELLLHKIVLETDGETNLLSFLEFLKKVSTKYFDSKLLGF